MQKKISILLNFTGLLYFVANTFSKIVGELINNEVKKFIERYMYRVRKEGLSETI